MDLQYFITMLLKEINGLLNDAALENLTDFEKYVVKKSIYNESFVNFAFLLLAKTSTNQPNFSEQLESAFRDTRAVMVKSIDEISKIASNMEDGLWDQPNSN